MEKMIYDNKELCSYVIENEYLKVEVSNLGAALLRFVDKKTGRDIVLGYNSFEEYLKNPGCLGATIGRNANRIANAEFCLNGITYKLESNNGPNNLHSGSKGFNMCVFDVIKISDDAISFKYLSKDGEGGFPGNLEVIVTYRLKDRSLLFEFSGSSDKDTVFNVTNHSYFNLSDEKEDVLNHLLKIPCTKVSLTDKDGLSLEDLIDVSGTTFDFLTYRKIGDNLKLKHQKALDGIDHNYVFENEDDKLMASLRYDGLTLDVYSDLPDMHVYTANFFDGLKGKKTSYHKHFGIALECQYYPNSINYTKYLKPLLLANKNVNHYIKYDLRDTYE